MGRRSAEGAERGLVVPVFWDGGQLTSTLDASVGAKRQTMPEKDRMMAALVPVPFTGDGMTADPITASEGQTYTHEGSVFRMHNVVGVAVGGTGFLPQSSRVYMADGVAPALQAAGSNDGQRPPTVLAFQERGREGGRSLEVGGPIAYALTAHGVEGGARAEANVLDAVMRVRRLMPVECELLQ